MESGEEENKGKSDKERKEEMVISTLLWLKPGARWRELGSLTEEGSWQGRLGLGGASITRTRNQRIQSFSLTFSRDGIVKLESRRESTLRIRSTNERGDRS